MSTNLDTEIRIKSQLIQKHDLEVNWNKAISFVPYKGQLIIYDIEVDADGNTITQIIDGVTKTVCELVGRSAPYTYERIKIGDGINIVSDLPFVDEQVRLAINALNTDVIINVSKLPTDNIEENKIYNIGTAFKVCRLGTGVSSGVGDMSSTIKTIVVDQLPDTSTALPGMDFFGSGTHTFYYCLSDNKVYVNITAELKANTPITGDCPIGWVSVENFGYGGKYDMAASSSVFTWGGVVTDIDNFTPEINNAYHLVIFSDLTDLYYRQNSNWIQIKTIIPGTGQDAEIFNNRSNIASGSYSHAEGYYTTASKDCSHAEGQSTTASGISSHAEGDNTVASGGYSHAEGYDTTASAGASHAEGARTKASGTDSHAEGDSTTAFGNGSHAEGISSNKAISITDINSTQSDSVIITAWSAANGFSLAKGEGSHVEGKDNLAFARYSHAEGDHTIVSGEAAHAEGKDTAAEGNYSHAEGEGSKASGKNSHAEGHQTTAAGSYSHAEGRSDSAPTDNSSNESVLAAWEAAPENAKFSLARGESTHVEGWNNIALGIAAHAEGNENAVVGNYAHAEGTSNKITGFAGHAEGSHHSVSGRCAHVEGEYNTATGDYSHAEGKNTTALGKMQHVQGKFNTADTGNTYAHIVGNGTAEASRSNAHTLDWNGNAWFAGNVKVGGTGQDDTNAKILATEDYVDSQIATSATRIKLKIWEEAD